MKDQKFTFAQYKQLQNLSLEEKIERADNLILDELKKAKKPCIACSWGKDSTVLLHLVRVFCPDILVVFHNTGVEYPQTFKYRDRLLKEWNISNYAETKPIKSFWQCVKEYGYPKGRQMGKSRYGSEQGKQRTPKCCYFCKEKPASNFHKEHEVDCEFVGLQASESMVRRLSFFREGESFNSKTYGCQLVRPLMIWTTEDIWHYHKIFGIPHNPLYDLMPRNGCMPCTGFKNWKAVMNRANPKMYDFVSKAIGEPVLNCWLVQEELIL